MAYTVVPTKPDGDGKKITLINWNTHIKANIDYLKAVLAGTDADKIATAALDYSAVSFTTLAPGTTNAPTTNSAAFVDMPDTYVITTDGGVLLLWGVASLQSNTLSSYSDVIFNVDGVDGGQPVRFHCKVAGYDEVVPIISYFDSLAAGAHSIRLRWRTSSGTLTADTTFRNLMMLELKR